MVWKYSVLVTSLTLVFFSSASSGSANQCGEVLVKVCVGCHQSDRFCAKLGAPEKEWRGLLKLMIANGAELEKEEIEPLALCLSGSAEEAKKVCAK